MDPSPHEPCIDSGPMPDLAVADQADPAIASRPLLVLIANDQEWSARSLETILGPHGYAVVRTYNGRQTLDLVLDPADGAGLSWLHRHTEVMSKALRDDGALAVTVRADPANAQKARAKFGRPEAHAH